MGNKLSKKLLVWALVPLFFGFWLSGHISYSTCEANPNWVSVLLASGAMVGAFLFGRSVGRDEAQNDDV
jgi:cell division protein FtsW (lipid II flippase)